MPMNRLTMARTAALLGVLLLAAACTASPPLRYFVLTPIESPPAAAAAEGRAPARGGPTTIGLQPVDLADYLDRQEIVTRRTPTAIDLAGLDRWGEPLDVQTGRVIVQNLTALLPGQEVFLLPTNFVVDPDRELVIEIDRFDADAEGKVHLEGRWQLNASRTGRVIVDQRTSITEPVAAAADGEAPQGPEDGLAGAIAGDTAPAYQDIALAMSRALATLSREIAAGVR